MNMSLESASQPNKNLANPFNKMFKDWQEAQWGFNLLQKTAEFLGVQEPDDALISVTCRYYSGHQMIRFNYGTWLILGINGKARSITSIHIALITDRLSLNWLYSGTFAKPGGEPQIALYEISIEDFRNNEAAIMNVFAETTQAIIEKFSNRKVSIHHRKNNQDLAAAILQLDLRESLLSHGIQPEETNDPTPDGVTRYWKIAPGEGAWNWEACKDGGFITVGWDELGDISELTEQEFKDKNKILLEQHPEWGSKGIEQVWDFAHIQIGDRIVANRGTKEVLGIGTVIQPYHFIPGIRHGHHLGVQWDDIRVRSIEKMNWVKTMIELKQKEFEEILKLDTKYFDEQTFSLLDQLRENPTQSFYNEHKADFKNKVESPFQSLMRDATKYLKPEILKQMETEKRIFARFGKNDYGKGGMYDYYWGAFYPKGGKRKNDPQLSLWMNSERLEIGFFIGSYGDDSRKLFRKNCQENTDKLLKLLNPIISDPTFIIGSHLDVTIQPDGSVIANNKVSWRDWLSDPGKSTYDISLVLPKTTLLKLTTNQLLNKVAETYNRLFPFILLATDNNPIPLIEKYLAVSVAEPYTLQQCSDETGIELSELERWKRALDRKGQVILYGPPGTGKTFIAKKFAKHLVDGGDGFVKFVQFHPEVSYEDFIQGIRPKSHTGGGLDYPVVPGRFLEFCEQARTQINTCVLIIDEINRANLARVFGELMYLLEYRGENVELSAGNGFRIPPNVRIIGTMNTADRSIALVDHALRRRFAMLALYPNFAILTNFHKQMNTGFDVNGLIGVLEDLNKQINDPHYSLGVSYFLRADLKDQIPDIWKMEIEPYLEEYFFDQKGKYQQFIWEIISKKVFK